MDDPIWSLKVSRHMLFSATWCEMVVLGRDRVPALERGAFLLLRPVSSQHGSSSEVTTSMSSQMGLHPVPEGREDELRSMTLPGCSMLPLLPCPMGLVLLEAVLKVLSCPRSHAGIRRGRPGQCPKPSLLLWLLLWFHQHKPLVMAPFSASRDPGWPCLLPCSRPQPNRALLLWHLFFFSYSKLLT